MDQARSKEWIEKITQLWDFDAKYPLEWFSAAPEMYRLIRFTTNPTTKRIHNGEFSRWCKQNKISVSPWNHITNAEDCYTEKWCMCRFTKQSDLVLFLLKWSGTDIIVEVDDPPTVYLERLTRLPDIWYWRELPKDWYSCELPVFWHSWEHDFQAL